MDPQFYATTFNKWLHLSAAGIVVGGLIYLRFVLIPTLDGVEESQRTPIWQAAYKRSMRWILYAFAVLILTGIDNGLRSRRFLQVATPDVRDTYWMVFWTKVAVVILAFILVHFLIIGAPPFRRIQEAYRRWVTVLVVAALLIVYFSGFLTLTRLSLIRLP
ncbi:MAG: hypothetical protein KY468_06085 [Armatimonadetes bacterium]|nr:hypothetical protein [Armatimonadota bacterium]